MREYTKITVLFVVLLATVLIFTILVTILVGLCSPEYDEHDWNDAYKGGYVAAISGMPKEIINPKFQENYDRGYTDGLNHKPEYDANFDNLSQEYNPFNIRGE
ncbi:hypothetical protein [Methanoplanus endosymbiosus]|uniref:Uncharacterized protein n=1 Tax=Methanoplanus endosymbiosus TaxID=33865 RepID=A0A9E7PKX6_9EURY|nr:hypothetical protein [Methanoplanus endosymbiosus]UUX92060.1 hypothetical protein L6E24_11955 [Methanoplanus endosymbiosus]